MSRTGSEHRPAPVAPGPRQTGAGDQDDVELLRRIVAGDRAALIEVYQRHAAAVLAQVSLVTGDRGLSEEVLQDTMLAVWRGAASFRGGAKVRSWIIAIARRQARDRLRRRRDVVTGDDRGLAERPSPQPGPEEVAIHRFEAEAVARAVAALGPAQREAVGLVFGGGLTLAEAAEVMDVPLGTVKSRLAAARAALARALSEKGSGS